MTSGCKPERLGYKPARLGYKQEMSESKPARSVNMPG